MVSFLESLSHAVLQKHSQFLSLSNLLHLNTDKKLIMPEIALFCHTQLKSFRELKRYLQEEGLKTSRVFLHKPHFPIKLCGFFSSESQKTFHGDCASEEQRLSFPLELVRLLSPGPFPKDHCIHPFAGEVSS